MSSVTQQAEGAQPVAETLAIPAAPFGVEPGQQLGAQPVGDLDLAHGPAEVLIGAPGGPCQGVTLDTTAQVALQLLGLRRPEVAGARPGVVQEQAGGATIHRWPSGGGGR